MKAHNSWMLVATAGLLLASSVFAQTSPAQKQKTQDGNSPTTVGPASGAYKQKTQSLSHGDVPVGVAKHD